MDTTISNSAPKNSNPKSSSKGKGRVAGTTGAVLGASGAIIIGKISDEVQAHQRASMEENVELSENNGQESVSAEVTYNSPSWVVGDLQVAEGVEESMSFSQAFDAARAEVGPGGAFEWHGKVYGTYTADEWNSMSATEKAEFNNHFNWNNVESESHVDAVGSSENVDQNIGVVSVVDDSQIRNEAEPRIEIVDADKEPEIEVLGVVHDPDTGLNIGELTVDGENVILVDVDGDLEFDI